MIPLAQKFIGLSGIEFSLIDLKSGNARSRRIMREAHSFSEILTHKTRCFPAKIAVAPLLLNISMNEVDTEKCSNKVRTPFSQITN